MANALYRKGAEKMLSGQINFMGDTVVARLARDTYAQNLTTDEFLSSVPAVTGATDQTLVSKSVTNGVFNAANVTFAAVPAGQTAEGIVLAKWTGSDATSPVLAYIDVITGFPLAANGGDIVIQWDAGAFKIFSL